MFVTHESDRLGVDVLRLLEKECAAETFVLGEGGFAGPNDVAIFSLNGKNNELHFPGRHARLSVPRLEEAGIIPPWASMSLYPVCFRQHPNEKTHVTIKETAKTIHRMYVEWFAGISKCECPWGCAPTGDRSETFDNWRKRTLSLGMDEATVDFFRFLEPLNQKCLKGAVEKISKSNGHLRVISAFCFHANGPRTGMVDNLNEEVKISAASLINDLPIKGMEIFTFHPDDMETLREYGLQDTVLKGFWGRQDLFQKQWDLSVDFARLCPKVVIRPIRDLFADSSLAKEAIRVGRSRAGAMASSIKKNPPPIFQFLSKKEIKEKLAAEAVLYLIMTSQFPESVYIGFEVHAEYWRSGELYQCGENLLPVLMVPKALRQHWAEWAVDEERLREIRKLALA